MSEEQQKRGIAIFERRMEIDNEMLRMFQNNQYDTRLIMKNKIEQELLDRDLRNLLLDIFVPNLGEVVHGSKED